MNRESIAQDIERFTAAHTEAKARWLYCLARMEVSGVTRRGDAYTSVTEKGAAAASRLINRGQTNASVLFWLRSIQRSGFEVVAQSDSPNPRLTVGPLPAWCVGHVYFLRVATHPHVLKIGFSRRVSDRVADLQSKAKCRLELDSAHVGTQLDEQHWHRRLKDEHITGEWFFDPTMGDKTLPSFLAAQVAA